MNITTASQSISYTTYGIYAYSGLSIKDSNIKLIDTSEIVTQKGSAIAVNDFVNSIKIEDANIEIDNYSIGINVTSSVLEIKNSTITGKGDNFNRGISGGEPIGTMSIIDSEIDFSTSEDDAVALTTGNDLIIDNSIVKLKSTSSNAIYTDMNIDVKNNSNLDLVGYYPAMYSLGSNTITDSTVNAVSTGRAAIYSKDITINGTSDVKVNGYYAGLSAKNNITFNGGNVNAISNMDIGIWSEGSININMGEIYSVGLPGVGAIGVRCTTTDTSISPVSKIILDDNYLEAIGGKISVSNWDGYNRSWTSFIGIYDNNILNSNKSNVINEISIKIKASDYTKVDEAIGKIPNDLSKYTEESVNALNAAKDEIIRGKDITEQGIVDGYAISIENAIKALIIKGENPPSKSPIIIDGMNQKVVVGSDATFRSDANFKDFVKLMISDKEVPKEYYTVREGSTIVTIKGEYLKTLEIGNYSISIVSTTGIASTNFSVLGEEEKDTTKSEGTTKTEGQAVDKTKAVKTSDINSSLIWIALIFVSSGMFFASLKRKKEDI